MDDINSFAMGEIRQEFPYLERCVYLNTAAVGICPKLLGAAAASYFVDVRSRGYDAKDVWRADEPKVRAQVAALIRVPASDICFTGSTTESLNLISQSLRIEPRQKVVYAADDFPSVRLAWAPHRAKGVELTPVRIPSERERTAALADAIDDRTSIICVSHVHWSTGTRVDLEELSMACRRHGTRLIVDGAQAVGAVNVDASCADAYAAPTFKWLLGDFGLAFVFVKKELQSQLEPVFRGYANEPPDRSLCYSHANHSAISVLGHTLTYLESIGWDSILWRIQMLTEGLSEQLNNEGWHVATPASARAGIISVACDAPELMAERLLQRECRVEARDGLLRLSPHFYNSEDDVRSLVNALNTLNDGKVQVKSER